MDHSPLVPSGAWPDRVFAGRDALTGRDQCVERNFGGNERDASNALTAAVTETDQLAT
jgi:hypothetical protein